MRAGKGYARPSSCWLPTMRGGTVHIPLSRGNRYVLKVQVQNLDLASGTNFSQLLECFLPNWQRLVLSHVGWFATVWQETSPARVGKLRGFTRVVWGYG